MNNLFEIIKEKKLVLKIVLLLLVTIIPWSLNNSSNEITPMQVTDDLSFYEINTCEFSLFKMNPYLWIQITS